jgi:hypothetical protein
MKMSLSGSLAVVKAGNVEKNKPKEASGKDRRKQERFDCDGFAEVIVDDAAFLFRGNIQNFSLGGCYIQSRAHLRLDRGAEVDLQFTLNDDLFKARARLMIVRPGDGAGFEFLFSDPSLEPRLVRLIRKLATTPSTGVVPETNTEQNSRNDPSRDLWNRAR